MKNAGTVLDTNWEGEWRFHDHLGWLPLPIWLEHVEATWSGLGPEAVRWIIDHVPEQWRSTTRPNDNGHQAEGEAA